MPKLYLVDVAEFFSLSFIVTFLHRSCSRKSSGGCPSENIALAIDMISASLVDLATDDWRRKFHAIGQWEDPVSKMIIMPDVEPARMMQDEHLHTHATLFDRHYQPELDDSVARKESRREEMKKNRQKRVARKCWMNDDE